MANYANRYSTLDHISLDLCAEPAPLTREDIGFDLSDPYQRANYKNFLTFEEADKVAWLHDGPWYHAGERNELDVYGVPVHEKGALVGAKVYQDFGLEFPIYIGFVACDESNFRDAVVMRPGVQWDD